MSKQYELDDLVMVAGRENNTKRSYLYVDPVQGKHIPVSPSASLELFRALSEKIESRYKDEKLLIVGFAETATAIGMAVAVNVSSALYYISTTREMIRGAEYLVFSESHSHASEQRLYTDGLDEALENVDRVIFIDDEITTGNTILHLIDELKKRFGSHFGKAGITSILNSMTDERLKELEEMGIPCDYICRLPYEYKKETLADTVFSDVFIEPDRSAVSEKDVCVYSGCSTRMVVETKTLKAETESLAERICAAVCLTDEDRQVTVIGTEEFMYQAMLYGSIAEKKHPGISIRFHATTRSPIRTSNAPSYPLFSRYCLDSFYDKNRTTYIYNLKKCDRVCIITDSMNDITDGMATLVNALHSCGCEKTDVIRIVGEIK